jgi:hypothetical protein
MGEVVDFNQFKQNREVNSSNGDGKELLDATLIRPQDKEFLLDQAQEMKKRGYTVGEIKSLIALNLSAALAAQEVGAENISELYRIKSELRNAGLDQRSITRNQDVYDHDHQLSNLSLNELFAKLVRPSSSERNTKPAFYGLLTQIIERKIAQQFDPGDDLIDRIYEQIQP